MLPEDYEVILEGNQREDETLNPKNVKKIKINKKKFAKEQRNKGEQYTSYATKKIIPARNQLQERCNGEVCRKFAKECLKITELKMKDKIF